VNPLMESFTRLRFEMRQRLEDFGAKRLRLDRLKILRLSGLTLLFGPTRLSGLKTLLPDDSLSSFPVIFSEF
jgi:hypothetical protein